MGANYTGRFAPSPTGPLHAGSLVAALASWLDARAHSGRWLVRIEDVDTPRSVVGADNIILSQLAACGLLPDDAPLWQSERGALYQAALGELLARGEAYPCACSRKDIEETLAALGRPHQRHAELVYPGSCRTGLRGRSARTWRFRTDASTDPVAGPVHWIDRRLGQQQQDVPQAVGDFVLRRADGCWAYQLAVVVDDAAQGVSHVVRGEDLADNTARQLLLQRALGLRQPAYLHTPLVLGANGEKLSKQNGAAPLQLAEPLTALNAAAGILGLSAQSGPTGSALTAWVLQWRDFYNRPVTEPGNIPGGAPLAAPAQSAEITDIHADAKAQAPAPCADAAGAPDHIAHPRVIRSFVRRAGRTTIGQAKAHETLGPQFLLPYAQASLDFSAAFGREAPTVLEIGFGMGEATAHIAALMPDKNFLCCEVHEPGVGALLKRIGERGLTNIRIVAHDAVEVIDHMLPEGSLAGIHIFFPDPWHKLRHNKRRLIQPPLVARLASRLEPGGYLHCATDWEPYAQQMLQVLGAEPQLRNTAPQWTARPDYRPLTKFENRGLKLGHGVWDLVFTRQ